MQSFYMRRQRVAWLMFLCLSVSAASGCAGQHSVPKITQVNYYPQCYQPIQALRDGDKSVAGDTATGAAVGGLLGGVLGYLITGRAEGAVVGAAAGAVGGGALAYSSAKQKQYADENVRMASYLQDLDGDISGLNIVKASALQSAQCYDREFVRLIKEYRSGAISVVDLKERYQEIRSGMQEAQQFLGSVIKNANKREEEYQAALTSETKTVRKTSDLNRVQKKKGEYSRTVRTVEKQKANLDSSCAKKDAEIEQLVRG